MAVVPAVVLEGRACSRRSGAASARQGDALRVFAIIAITTILSVAVVAAVFSALLTPLPRFFDLYLAGVVANSDRHAVRRARLDDHVLRPQAEQGPAVETTASTTS